MSLERGLHRLRGRTARELGVRARQAVAARLDRLGLSARVRLPADARLPGLIGVSGSAAGGMDAFEAWFRTRAVAPIFGVASNPDAARLWCRLENRPSIDEFARRVDAFAAGRFDLLGFTGLEFGCPIDWHLDPATGRRNPVRHWSTLNLLDASEAGDRKIVWELNRHQWFLVPARAWRLTGDPRYSAFFCKAVDAWMDANPPGIGVSWASSLEVSFRSISWLWALHFFRDAAIPSPLLAKILKFLHAAGRHLETYLSTYSSPNTHLTGEALGLVYLGAAFPEFRAAERWRRLGTRVMLEALPRHVLGDGVYFEHASYYHRYTADIYTHLYLLTRQTDSAVAATIRPRLVALLDHLLWIARPDGTTPFYGDDDGGRLVALDDSAADDFRATLSTGAALLGVPAWKHAAAKLAEETFWLLGAEGMAAFERVESAPPAQPSRGFTEGGYYVMRDGWERGSNWLLADVAPHGGLNCGHAHADALSIQLAANGTTLLGDPGTFCYTANARDRDAFRSSLMHGTVSVDGQSSSVPAGPFSWRHVANVTCRRWLSEPSFDFLEGEHDGYRRLTDPVVHRRSILFIRGSYWVVRDRLEAAGRHQYSSHFQFASGTRASLAGDCLAVGAGDSVLQLWGCTPDASWQLGTGRVSRAYGASDVAPSADYVLSADGAVELLAVLAPVPASRATTGATRPAAHGLDACATAGGLEVRGESWTDRFLSHPSAGELPGGIVATADVAWARHHRSSGSVDLLAIGPRAVSAGGIFSLEPPAPIDWLSVRLSSGILQLALPAGHQLRLVPGPGARKLFVNGLLVACEPGTALMVG